MCLEACSIHTAKSTLFHTLRIWRNGADLPATRVNIALNGFAVTVLEVEGECCALVEG